MRVFTSVAHPEKEAGDALAAVLHKYRDNPVLLLCSGGSALAILEHVPADAVPADATLSVLDERHVADPSASNFEQLKQTTFYRSALARGGSAIAVLGQKDEPLEQVAARFEASLHDWKNQKPEGVIVITQGIGTDGHTAGIFPNQPLSFENGWVVGYELVDIDNPYPRRITTTFHFLRGYVDHSVCFAVGEEKKEVVSRLQHNVARLQDMPASIICEMREVQLFTDVAL